MTELVMGMSAKGYFAIENQKLARVAREAPMLDKDHELNLARRWKDQRDPVAIRDLTQSYLRLVIAMAARFQHYGLPASDLVQEGTVGLMEAAARFEPDRDIRFSTYASWWIRSAMQDFVLRNWSIVRTGTTAAHKSLFFNLRRLRAQIAGEIEGPMPASARAVLADRLGVRVKDVEVMEGRLTGGDRSLNAPVGEDGDAEWMDRFTCDAPLPDEAVGEAHDAGVKSAVIADALGKLNDRERAIIVERQLGDGEVTLATLGDRLGISKERVRQIEAIALGKLRAAIMARVGDPVAAGLVLSMS